MARETSEGALIFEDRADAGRLLAQELSGYQDKNPIVLALPRGGVVVGYEVARALHAPLDVIVARKLGAPGHEELGIGAIAPGGVLVLEEQAVAWIGISEARLQRIVARETAEMNRRLQLYRGDRPLPDLRDRTAILVDDGLATGVTARAAILSLKQQHPQRLVLAVPVCASETTGRLRGEVDDLICASIPLYFRAVGLWYRRFEQTTDQEVVSLLARAAEEERLPDPAASSLG
jgi:predicted phosphoribosyltransferase